jgi:AcrR family transcriptional regulator
MTEHAARTTYQIAREAGQQVLYETVLALASSMIAESGVGALSMRNLAGAAGCSTTVLYTLFGSKAGILEALFVDGFARLGAAHAALGPLADSRERVIALCLAYRRFALDHPTHYHIMFGGALEADTPLSAASKGAALDAMRPLMQAVAGVLEIRDEGRELSEAADLGMMLWSAAHGFVSLELAGMSLAPERAEALYMTALRRLLG